MEFLQKAAQSWEVKDFSPPPTLDVQLLETTPGGSALFAEKKPEPNPEGGSLERSIDFFEEDLKAMDISYREKAVHDRLIQTYGIKLSELRPEDSGTKEMDREALESQIVSLKEKVEAFGPVNLLAVDEYEELKHRYDFLAGQEKDLG